VLVATTGMLLPVAINAASASSAGVTVSVLASAAYGRVLVVGSGQLAGTPLYEFSGDVNGKLACGTTPASGYDLGPVASMPLTCTGPERDFIRGVKSDDWPALTTSAPPQAGKGVDPKLLGTVERSGVGDQVTYAGHPLYLFDPPSRPFDPQGEGYIETVAPLAPWHGYWFLVSAANGEPDPGRATLEVGRLPDGERVVAVEVDANVSPLAASVYRFSRDPLGVSTCTDACSATWIPVLTTSTPRVLTGVPAKFVGVVRRRNGTDQVTFDDKPLYLYAREKTFLTARVRLRASGTAGNGNGLAGPQGGRFSLVDLKRSS
jgi:predicted lipoprotein with Yx(FWY)xxD motif